MFGDYVFEKTAAQYTKKMMLVDADHLEEKAHYSAVFQAHGFRTVVYTDDLNFRVNNTSLLNGEEKLAILVQPGVYVPYDIRKKCREEEISFESLFPKLNSAVLRESKNLDLELLTLAYQTDFEEYHERKQTEMFLRLKMYAQKNVELYLRDLYECALNQAKSVEDYRAWFELAEKKATIDVTAAEHNVDIDTSELNRAFCAYAMKNFGKLSSEINLESPVMVSSGPGRKFCVSDIRQSQEYHVINVHIWGLFPLVTAFPGGWGGMRAEGRECRHGLPGTLFQGDQPTLRSANMMSS